MCAGLGDGIWHTSLDQWSEKNSGNAEVLPGGVMPGRRDLPAATRRVVSGMDLGLWWKVSFVLDVVGMETPATVVATERKASGTIMLRCQLSLVDLQNAVVCKHLSKL